MRISDWSSDVCSSDLALLRQAVDGVFDVAAFVVAGHQHRDGRIVRGHAAHRPAVQQDRRDEEGIHEARHVGDERDQRERQRSAEQPAQVVHRSEEHTSELQSLMRISYAVFCLKKNKKTNIYIKYERRKAKLIKKTY